MSHPHWLGMVLGLTTMLGTSCYAQSQTECHREAVRRLGCCPTCSSDCRASVSQECAEIHDVALVEGELDEDEPPEPDGETTDEEPDDEVRPD
ncbi:MAG: hypothetical protein AB1Z98_29595 [Nannocystaceae bacterium]